MTKIDGHKHYDQKIGHYQFGQATSDPTWPILRGRIVTKRNGRNLNLAQSSRVALDGPSPVTRPFNSESQPFCDQLFFYNRLFAGFFVWALAFLQPFCCLVPLGLGLFAIHFVLGF
jgi:hypothetical protein